MLFAIASIILAWGCEGKKEPPSPPRFVSVPREHSQILFANHVNEDAEHHYFRYSYMYNGGGVAAGDLDNDGLPELYFTANQGPNRLYRNTGGLRFQDITEQASVGGREGWSTGVTFVDINNDGFLDIYVCYSGDTEDPAHLRNQLFVNNKNLTFTEQSAEYGIDDPGHSTQAYFFDADNDGDLDLYVVNHRIDFKNNILILDRTQWLHDPMNSDRLYRNEGNGSFTDITVSAGIANASWGLGAAIGDFNDDGWEDIYVANDFLEPDFLYINNGDGTFSERLSEFMKHTSFYGMGCDLSDFNNDGLLDLFVLDMVSADHLRSKRNMASLSTTNFRKMVEKGYHYQYMINTLQMNNGGGSFSEVAQLVGVDKTDWSWGPLFADFDNDGWKDIFVTNGIKRDVTDNDFKSLLKTKIEQEGRRLDFQEVMNLLPSTPVKNLIYRNGKMLKFEDVTESWNLRDALNSNGSVYADLDGDGDLDIVTNNLDAHATVYENQMVSPANYLRIRLNGSRTNPFGIGARVTVHSREGTQLQQMYLSRGFQSSGEALAHFGLGTLSVVDSVVVQWDQQMYTTARDVPANHILSISISDAEKRTPSPMRSASIFRDVTRELRIDHVHLENAYDDFLREILLPHRQSQHGPFISVGDVNGDHREDFFIGGSAGYAGVLYVQTAERGFQPARRQPWDADRHYEDLGSLFFDAENDGDLDLYVVSGGNEFELGSPMLQDRLYINDGAGVFTRSAKALPTMRTSGLRVAGGDFDGDGDTDLFVGGRVMPGKYPYAPQSYLLRNDEGIFRDVTTDVAPGLLHAGMVSDAVFFDYDKDGDLDLAVVGEWMPVSIFQNDSGRFTMLTPDAALRQTEGWWFTLAVDDVDNDGDPDLIAGNIGLNTKFKVGTQKPLLVYSDDFDGNGRNDIVLAKHQQDICYPVRGKECSTEQIPGIRDRFATYRSFAEASIEQIYSEEKLAASLQLRVHEFQSCIVRNEGNGTFRLDPLARIAQVAPVRGIGVIDFNRDGLNDLVIAGNMFGAEVETVRYDAGMGLCLLATGNGDYTPVRFLEAGFSTPGDVTDLKLVRVGDVEVILVANNQGKMQAFAPSAVW